MKSKQLCIQTVPEVDDFSLKVEVWREVLTGEVPESRFNDCLMLVARSRDSTFPIWVSEICQAWRQIQEMERQPTPVKPGPEAGVNLPPSCNLCFGSGWQVVPGKGAKRCECQKMS